MSAVKIWNAWKTLGINYPTHCQYGLPLSSPTRDPCKRTLTNTTSRNKLLEDISHELPSEAISHLETLATQSLCTFCATKDDRRNVLLVSWKLKMNEVLSSRLRFFSDQETALLDEQEVMHVRDAEFVTGYKELQGKVQAAESKYEGEVQQHEVSKRTIQELLKKVNKLDADFLHQSVEFDISTEKNLSLSQDIYWLKEENERLKKKQTSMQQLWERRNEYHTKQINSLTAVRKIFVTAQQKLADQWAVSGAAMDVEFRDNLLNPTPEVKGGATGGLPSPSNSHLSDEIGETPPGKKRKLQATVEDCADS